MEGYVYMNKKDFANIIMRLKNDKISDKDIEYIKKEAELKQMIVLTKMIKRTYMCSKVQSKAKEYDYILLNRFPPIFTGQFREEPLLREIIFELRFLTTQIIVNCNEINEFFCAKKIFECLFMKGKFLESIKCIENFEKDQGYSFWSIDCNISARAYIDTKMTHEYCDNIIAKCENPIIKAYVSIAKHRFLKNVTGRYFKILEEEVFRDYFEGEKESPFKKYIYTNLNIISELDLNEIRSLLLVSNYATLVDKYIILEKILGWLSSETIIYHNKHLKGFILESAKYIREKIDSPFWKNICVLLGDKKEIIIEEEKRVINHGFKLFYENKKKDCHEYCLKMLKKYPDCFSLINLLAKSGECEIEMHCCVPYLELANFIRKLYLKEGKDTLFAATIQFSDVYERIYSLFSFGKNLAVIVENETTPLMILGKISYLNALLSSNYTPSKLAFFLPNDEQEQFLFSYREKVGELYFCDWQISTYSEANKKVLNSFRCDKTSLILNKIKNEAYDIDDLWNKLCKEDKDVINSNICKSFFLKRQFDLAVSEEDLLKAIEIYIKAYFISQWMVIKFDYRKINEKISRKLKQYLENYLSYCIYADVTRFELSKGEKISETVVNSCRKIIQKKGGDFKELLNVSNELEKKKAVYFLRQICTYEGLRRVKTNISLTQELYAERIRIIECILPYYEDLGSTEDVDSLKRERDRHSKKIDSLDIAKCINRGKINTGWIVFSDEASQAIISVFNMYKEILSYNLFSVFLNAFAIVKKDYVQEVNRILSIAIRHGILEGELLRFLQKNNLNFDSVSLKNKECIDEFYQKIFLLIDSLLKDYIVATYKYEKSTKLLLYVDEVVLQEKFNGLPKVISSPEELSDIYMNILNEELEKKLIEWGDGICGYIKKEIATYLEGLYNSCDAKLKADVNKTSDLLDEEISKLKEWFRITENQDIEYRLTNLVDVLEQEWTGLSVTSNIDKNIIVNGNVINFFYTIIRELIWNAEKHSGFREGDPRLKIKIKLDVEDEDVLFEVGNNIEDNVEFITIEQNIVELRDIIASVEKSDYKIFEGRDIYEGKSGYKKIVKLLKRAYDGKYHIDLKSNKNEFIVTVKIVLEELY